MAATMGKVSCKKHHYVFLLPSRLVVTRRYCPWLFINITGTWRRQVLAAIVPLGAEEVSHVLIKSSLQPTKRPQNLNITGDFDLSRAPRSFQFDVA